MSELSRGDYRPSDIKRAEKKEPSGAKKPEFPLFFDTYFGPGTRKNLSELFGGSYMDSYVRYQETGELGSEDEVDEYLMLDIDTAKQIELSKLLAKKMIDGIKYDNLKKAIMELDSLVKRGDNPCTGSRTPDLFNAINQVGVSLEAYSSTKVVRFHGDLFLQALNSLLILRLLTVAKELKSEKAVDGLRQLMTYNKVAREGNKQGLPATYSPFEFLNSTENYVQFISSHDQDISPLVVAPQSESEDALRWYNNDLAREVADQSVFKKVTKFRRKYEFKDVPILVELLDMQSHVPHAQRDVSRICLCLVTFLHDEWAHSDFFPKTHEVAMLPDPGDSTGRNPLMSVKFNLDTFALTLDRNIGDIRLNGSSLSLGEISRALGQKNIYESLRYICLRAVKEYFDNKMPDVESYINSPPARVKEAITESSTLEGVDSTYVSGMDVGDDEDGNSAQSGNIEISDSTVSVSTLELERPEDNTYTTWLKDLVGVDGTVSREKEEATRDMRERRLPLPRAISGTDVYRAFVQICGRPIRQNGSHAIFSLDGKTTPVPVKGHFRYGVGMLQKNLKTLNISHDVFLKAAGYQK